MTHVAIAKRNLDVSTRMSDVVFLDPFGGDKRTVFVYVRNTSARPNFDIETPIESAIADVQISEVARERRRTPGLLERRAARHGRQRTGDVFRGDDGETLPHAGHQHGEHVRSVTTFLDRLVKDGDVLLEDIWKTS